MWGLSRNACWQPFGEVICRVETDRPIVALSFDDGPTARGLDAVLPELERRGVKATFFVVGNAAEKHPEQVRRLLAAGHEVGNHSWSHERMIFRTPAFVEREVGDTDRLLRRLGADPTYFRPPFFKRFWLLPRAVERHGLLLVTADVTDEQAGSLSPDALAADMAARARPGSILLLHPMFGGNDTQRHALPLLLDALGKKGLEVVPVGVLLARSAAE